jgi:hypothetical protein
MDNYHSPVCYLNAVRLGDRVLSPSLGGNYLGEPNRKNLYLFLETEMETESGLRNVVFYIRDRTTVYVHNCYSVNYFIFCRRNTYFVTLVR